MPPRLAGLRSSPVIDRLQRWTPESRRALAEQAPFDVVSSVTEDQVAFWLADGLVHGVGSNLAEATDDFLDALVDYAQSWFEDLRNAPNHAHNRLLVLRVVLHAGDREELERVVFDD